VKVKETKCIACGDPYCQFEVFPAEEKKETKT
jgi:predicted hydrocarbon binding protein